MTNKEVCLRLSSPERKKKSGVCGGNGRECTRIIRTLSCTQQRGQWNGCPTSDTLASTWPAKSTGPFTCVYQGPEERTSFLGRLSSVGAREVVLCLYSRANTESVIRYRTAVW